MQFYMHESIEIHSRKKVTCIFAFDETIDTPLYTAWTDWFECSVTCVTDQEPFGTQVL